MKGPLRSWTRGRKTGGCIAIDLATDRIDRAPLTDDLVAQANAAIDLAQALRELIIAVEAPGSARLEAALHNGRALLRNVGLEPGGAK